MRITLLLALILIGSMLYAQNHKEYYSDCLPGTPNVKEEGTIRNGKKEGHWKFYYPCLKDQTYSGLREEGNYSNDKKTGEWKYYPPGISFTPNTEVYSYSTVRFENGLEQGDKITYFKSGNIYQKTTYKDGKVIGQRFEYLQDGTLVSSENFETGEIKIYWGNGQLKETGFYELQKDWLTRKGEWKTYHKNGKLKTIGTYSNSEKTGIWSEFYDNGQLQARGEMKGSARVGRWELFHANGKPSGTGIYNNDGSPKIGTWTVYNSRGEKDESACPEPVSTKYGQLCNLVDSRATDEDENSKYNFLVEKQLEALACIDPINDNAEEVKRKVQQWWNKYHNDCKCDRVNFMISNGNILKFIVQSNFTDFLYSIIKNYQLNLNFIDPADGKTVLDFAVEEYETFRKNNPNHSLVKTMEKNINLLKDGGAKRAKEL